MTSKVQQRLLEETKVPVVPAILQKIRRIIKISIKEGGSSCKTHETYKIILQSEGHYTGLVLLNVEGAFDCM